MNAYKIAEMMRTNKQRRHFPMIFAIIIHKKTTNTAKNVRKSKPEILFFFSRTIAHVLYAGKGSRRGNMGQGHTYKDTT